MAVVKKPDPQDDRVADSEVRGRVVDSEVRGRVVTVR